MQAIIFIGIQGTGKSSFYFKQFFNSHIRISMDLLNTRNKENIFLETCFLSQSRFVVDNTNPTMSDRALYINKAKENKYEVIGYYFNSSLEEALNRNSQRQGKEKVPEIGIKGCYRKLEIPSYQEGFDKLYYVKLDDNQFIIEDWKNEI
ncbi:ATP-binding protein [Fulvivirga ulvae]|uniref:ATP-binding protein n=1 Tax=Fulvivirga ulvae TaxID=2904245 RepID=UPI001F26B856|nr:ATP-binding protein [Fulvivirga ulvae]UII29679.1 ATP-binding protein [Fulvivirga ulvae]